MADNTMDDKIRKDGAREPLHKTDGKSSSSRPGEFHPPDGGWGWVVCVTSMWTNGTVFGIINTFGIVYVHMRDLYAANDPDISFKTSWVGSVCTGMTFLMSMVASIISDRIGIRKTAFFGGLLGSVGLLASAFVQQLPLLYFTYGILLGLGSAFAYSPSLVILGHYFRKHMGLVNGFVTFGSALFTIVFSLCLPRLLENVGLKYTFIFLSGIEAVLMLCALTWKPLLHKESNLSSIALSTESVYEHCTDCCSWTRKFLNVRIWRNKGYVIWALSCGISLFGYFVPFVHLVKHTNDIFPGSDGSILLMCLSITSGVGRIVFGKVADFKCMNRVRMQQVAFAVFGITTMCIPFASNFASLIVITLVMGICDGIFICLLGPIAFDLVGPSSASQAIGFLLGIFSVPLMVGPPMAGLLYDHMGTYKIAFHVAGTPPIIGAIIMFLIPRTKQKYPAVTETMEFAAVSLHNILEVPTDDANKKINGAGGPSTEMIIIKDGAMFEKLRNTEHHSDLDEEEPAPLGPEDNLETTKMLSAEEVNETESVS